MQERNITDKINHNVIGFTLISVFAIVQASNYILQTLGNTSNGILTLLVFVYISIYKCVICRKIKIKKIIVCSFIYLLICILYKYFSVSSAAWGNIYIVAASVCCIVVMVFIDDEFSQRQKRYFAIIILTTYLIDSLYNISFFSVSSYGLSDEYSLKAHNSTALSLLSAIVFILILRESQKFKKILLSGLLIVISYLNIVIMARATNVILLIICYVLLFLFNGTDDKKQKKKTMLFFTFILSLILVAFLPSILNAIINSMSSTSRFKPRLEGLLYFIRGQQYTSYLQGSVAVRAELIMASLKTWVSDLGIFFFGKGDHRYTHLSVASAFALGIGGHSDVADVLARYGLFGGSFFYLIYKYTYDFYKKTFYNTGIWTSISIVFFFYLARSLFGVTFMPTICCVVYMLIPTIPSLLRRKNV